jgi:hypothetical protein
MNVTRQAGVCVDTASNTSPRQDQIWARFLVNPRGNNLVQNMLHFAKFENDSWLSYDLAAS